MCQDIVSNALAAMAAITCVVRRHDAPTLQEVVHTTGTGFGQPDNKDLGSRATLRCDSRLRLFQQSRRNWCEYGHPVKRKSGVEIRKCNFFGPACPTPTPESERRLERRRSVLRRTRGLQSSSRHLFDPWVAPLPFRN